MLPLVRMGDSLSPFGGEVLEGHYEAFGKPVACVGDQARCDLHGLTHITEGTTVCDHGRQARGPGRASV